MFSHDKGDEQLIGISRAVYLDAEMLSIELNILVTLYKLT